MKILAIAALLGLALGAAPDCWDQTVTKLRTDYIEPLPVALYYGKVDWFDINGSGQCGFYTYGNVYFESYNSSVVGVYFTFIEDG